MVIFQCPTCGKQYEVRVTEGRISYMVDTRLIILRGENDDCNNCQEEIKQSIEAKRAEMRAKRAGQSTQ